MDRLDKGRQLLELYQRDDSERSDQAGRELGGLLLAQAVRVCTAVVDGDFDNAVHAAATVYGVDEGSASYLVDRVLGEISTS